MEQTTRPKTKKQIEAELEDTNRRLQEAVEALHQARSDAQIQKRRGDEFKQAADNLKLKFDATTLQLQKLAQHKGQYEAADELISQLEKAKHRLVETEYHYNLMVRARDDNAAFIVKLRDRVFELEHGIEGRIAKAEGEALFYKTRLIELIRSLEGAMSQAGVHSGSRE